MRKLKFNLNVDSSALLNANPIEFYSKAYVSEDVVNNFRTLPGIKNKTKIATTAFNNLLKESSCNFTSENQTLSAIDIDVCSVSALAQICRFDVEASYLSLQMAKGANASFEVASFMNFYWDQMAKQIAQEVEQIRWKGDSTNVAYDDNYLGLCDGYEYILDNTVGVVGVTATTITSSNVIGELEKVYNEFLKEVPSAITRIEDVRIYVSPSVASAYKLATASGNTLAYVTKSLDLTFLDIKISVQQGLSNGKIVMTLKDNLIYAFDGEGDGQDLKAVNLEETVAEPLLRTRANLKIGFAVVNPTEIVYYS